jgi:hypothetical protein
VLSQGVRVVLRGEITALRTKDAIAGAVVRLALPPRDMRLVRARGGSDGVTVLEAKTDGRGRFELDIPATTEGSTASIDVCLPGYGSLAGTLMAGGDPRSVALEPDATTELSLVLPRALYVAGEVIDEQSSPVAEVEVTATKRGDSGYRYVTTTTTDSAGRFAIYDFGWCSEGEKGVIELKHRGFQLAVVPDVYALTDPERSSQKVVLKRGCVVSGRVISSVGRVVPDVMVEARFQDYAQRRAVLTDADGSFVLEGLPRDARCTLVVQAKKLKEKSRRELELNHDFSLDLNLAPIVLRSDPEKVQFLGMTLTTVTDELRDAYDLREGAGVLVLDAGLARARFGLGALEDGDRLWMVGDAKITTVADMAKGLLEEATKREDHTVRIVYDFADVSGSGTFTDHMKLTEADLDELRAVGRH